MKRGKDEGKIMGPMFPRLHVNDTEKGGPRAPPRNKMALYEQLTIPSHRFTNSDQGVASESGAFFSYQLPNRHQSENICGQYSDFSSIPLTPVSWRKKSDEEDFRVPVFNHSVQTQERRKCGNDPVQEKVNHPSKFHKLKRTGMLESNMRQEGKSRTEKNSQECSDRAKAVSNSSSIEKQNDSPVCHERRDCPSKSIDRLQTHNAIELELRTDSVCAGNGCTTSVLEKGSPTLDERNSAAPLRDQRNSCDLGPAKNLDTVDSVSEISVLELPDMTPDDVVGIIGQKHFWKARKAILNQRRVFAIQVFELHRLIKVQRLIAESPQILVNNSFFLDKPDVLPLASPVKAIPDASKHTASPIEAFPDVSKRKAEPKKASQNKESLAEKASFSLMGHGGPWCFNQPQGHQWLIPVLTPSEGLVYKPYPGPGFVGPNPTMDNFLLPPAYGIPPHYQGCYFPTYGMPAAALSGSSVEQMNPQASRASSPVERLMDSRGSNDMERGNVLSLFPVAPDSSLARPEPDRLAQVIKVVPHNATSATESAARIFRSIQEERRQYDSV